MARQPASLTAFFDEVGAASRGRPPFGRRGRDLGATLGDRTHLEARARAVVEKMALVLQGSLLVRYSPPAVADGFCASRLGGDGGLAFGTLPDGLDVAASSSGPLRSWGDSLPLFFILADRPAFGHRQLPRRRDRYCERS